MPRPHFDAALIDELKAKVISHNQTDGAQPVKLQQLRKLYASGYRGRDPHAAAMAKIDAELGGLLAKIDEPFDETEHPRANDGKFTSKGGGGGGGSRGRQRQAPPRAAPQPKPKSFRVSTDLPATQEEHQRLIRENAGYAAMQSAVIPETRNEMDFAAVRDLALFGTGVGLATSLARGKSNGVVARMMRGVGGGVGRWAGALAGGVVRRGAKGAEIGEKAGRKVGQGAFRASSKAMRGLMATASAGARTKGVRAARRAAVVAAVGAYPALMARGAIKGTPVDPEVWGHTLDQYETRHVQKLLDAPGLDEAQALMMEALNKGGDIDDLRKALQGGWSRAGMAAWTAAAGAAGALAGAGAGAGAHAAVAHVSGNKKGNPYHDKDGKFTSSANAKSRTLATIGGAVAGGALAAGLTYAAMRRGNVKAARSMIAASEARLSHRLKRATVGKGYGKPIGDAIEARAKLDVERPKLVDEFVTKHLEKDQSIKAAQRGVKAVEEAVARYGGTYPLHYQKRIAQEVNDKLSRWASSVDNFIIPKGPHGPATTVGELRRRLPERNRETLLANRISDFVSTAKKTDFDKAIEKLSPEEKLTANHWFEGRPKWVGEIETKLADHHAKIHETETHIAAAQEAVRAARRNEADAIAVLERQSTAKLKAVEQKKVNAATAAVNDAVERHDKLTAELEKLKTTGPDIRSPVNDARIPPATPFELQSIVDDAKEHAMDVADAARKRATDLAHKSVDAQAKAMDAGIERLREDNKTLVSAVYTRHMASLAMSGRGSLPKSARAAAENLQAANREIADARQTLRDFIREGRDKQQIDAVSARLAQKVKDAAAATTAFRDAMKEPPKAKRTFFNMLPNDVREDLIRDIKRGTANVKGALKGFLEKPTMSRLSAFANEKKRQATSAGKGVFNTLFMIPDGKGGQTISWMKTSKVLGMAGAGSLAVKEGYDQTKTALFGQGEERAKARRKLASTIVHDWEVDPITGLGYSALTIAHPTEKGERLVIYGEHQKNGDATPRMIEVGGRISKVRQAFKEGRLGGGGDHGEGGARAHSGDLFGFQGDDQKKTREAIGQRKQDITRENVAGTENVRVAFLPDNKNQPDIANKVRDFIAGRYLNNNSAPMEKQHYFHALQALFSNEATILTPQQRWSMLTNRDQNGGRGNNKRAVFGNSDAFSTSGSDDAGKAKIVSGLSAEIDRAMQFDPSDDQKVNLHRVLHIAKVAKGLSADALKPLHAKIGSVGGAAQAKPQQQQAAPKPAGPGPVRAAANAGIDSVVELPSGWSKDELHRESMIQARKVREHLGGHRDDDALLAATIGNIVKATAHTHSINMPDAMRATTQAIYAFGGAGHQSRQAALDEFRDGFPEHTLADLIDEKVSKIKAANKVYDPDDIDELMKLFGPWDEAKHPRAGKGSDRGGEFTSRGGDAAAARGAGEIATARGQRGRHDRLNEFHPIALTRDTGAFAGMEAAWQIAGKYLPTGKGAKAAMSLVDAISNESGSRIAGKVAEKPVESIARTAAAKFLPGAFGAAVTVGSLGVKLAASAAGGAAGSWGGERAARAAYRAAGKDLPDLADKSESLGRTAADAGGQLVGSWLGGVAGAVGGPVGSFAGSVAGAVAGGAGARLAYDAYHNKTIQRVGKWFTGYPDQLLQSAMGRFMSQETKHA